MSKKFSILSRINLKELNNQIVEYIRLTGETNPYLFMNQDTIDALEKEVEFLYPFQVERINVTNRQSDGVVCEYYGYKVFKNNTLDFCMVEIR